MKPCLADVNVCLALMVVHHEHHALALKWFDGLASRQAGICRLVQLALMRLLGNRSMMGTHVQTASAAWNMLETLNEDERIEFIPEPQGLDAAFPKLLKYPISTPKLVTDAYLAAFAITSERTIVTLDQGFRQFEGLDVLLID